METIGRNLISIPYGSIKSVDDADELSRIVISISYGSIKSE